MTDRRCPPGPRYRRSPSLIACAAGDDLVVVSTRTGAVHVLDRSAAHLLRAAAGWATVDELVDSYPPGPVARDQVRAGLEAALEEMTRLRLVDRS